MISKKQDEKKISSDNTFIVCPSSLLQNEMFQLSLNEMKIDVGLCKRLYECTLGVVMDLLFIDIIAKVERVRVRVIIFFIDTHADIHADTLTFANS